MASSNPEVKVTTSINKEHLREMCVTDTEQLVELTNQLTALLKKQECTIKLIEQHQQRIMGILRSEIQLAFTR